jgi:hypothetical protein
MDGLAKLASDLADAAVDTVARMPAILRDAEWVAPQPASDDPGT